MNQSSDTTLRLRKVAYQKIGHSLGTPIKNWLVTSFKWGQVLFQKNLSSIYFSVENLISEPNFIVRELLPANLIESISANHRAILHEITTKSNQFAFDCSHSKIKRSNNTKGNLLASRTVARNVSFGSAPVKRVSMNATALMNVGDQDKTVLG